MTASIVLMTGTTQLYYHEFNNLDENSEVNKVFLSWCKTAKDCTDQRKQGFNKKSNVHDYLEPYGTPLREQLVT